MPKGRGLRSCLVMVAQARMAKKLDSVASQTTQVKRQLYGQVLLETLPPAPKPQESERQLLLCPPPSLPSPKEKTEKSSPP